MIAVLLLLPGHWRQVRAVDPKAAKWFVGSAILVYLSQVFAYMAVAIAPITLTAPIIALANVFRIHLSHWLNPDHEVFGPDVDLGDRDFVCRRTRAVGERGDTTSSGVLDGVSGYALAMSELL